MKTKYYITCLLTIGMTIAMQAQSMRWIPTPPKTQFGKCMDQSTKSGLTQCYVLEYTPAVSGVLTSYTTGFLVSCTSLGSAIAKNQTCGMTPNNNVVNGCSSIGKVLLNSSGNSGSMTNNQVQAAVPVILHQVCLSIPMGESVSIEKDPVTNLTTSIDLGNGKFQTEYPSFQTATFSRTRLDDATHTVFLDFKGQRAGPRITQLDWSVTSETPGVSYVIERSFDNEVFEQIGDVSGPDVTVKINVYQFYDRDAQLGSNFYRLRQVDVKGNESVSPVREIVFEEFPFEVNASPNPARDKLYVKLSHAKEPGTLTLLDVSGKERIISDFEVTQSTLILDVTTLEQGMYTLQVTSGDNTHIEKIVVMPR